MSASATGIGRRRRGPASTYWQASSLGDLCDKRFRRSAIAITRPDWPSQPSFAAHLGARVLTERVNSMSLGDDLGRVILYGVRHCGRVFERPRLVWARKNEAPRGRIVAGYSRESRATRKKKRLGECNRARRWKIAGQLRGGPSFLFPSIFLPLFLSALGSFRGCRSCWGNQCGVATAGRGRACRRSLGGVSVQVGLATKGLEDVTVDGTADGLGILYAAVMRRCPARGEVGSRRGMGEGSNKVGQVRD